MPFGAILLYYLGVSFFYFWLKEFLKSDSFLFVIILSFIFVVLYHISIVIISEMSDIYIDIHVLFATDLKNLFFFPFFWWSYSFLYNKYFFEKKDFFGTT